MVYQSEDPEADAKISIPTEIEIVDRTPTNEQMGEVVEQIVDKWNSLVTTVQNTTIRLCLMIQDMIKDYPEATVKEVLQQVRSHPNIKRFVSIDRIWQGLRLIKRRPELIQYHHKNEEDKEKTPEQEKPYLKKDGEIFWEFYFELAKQPMSEGILVQIERQGKEEGWSFRDLRKKISEAKDEISDEPTNSKNEKYELIKQLIAVCRNLKVENVRGVLSLAKEFAKDNLGDKK